LIGETSDLVEQLKKKILRSGFPLEIKVASVVSTEFEKIYSDISTSPYYLDRDEDKGRELDIKAQIPIGTNKDSPMIFLNLLIECKNVMGNSWIFYESPHSVAVSHRTTSILEATNWFSDSSHFMYNSNLHYHNIPITTVNDEFVTDRKTSNGKTNNLFEAITTLIKATDFEEETEKSNLRNLIYTDPQGLNYINVYYPIIIFNGTMFKVNQVEKGFDMKLEPVSHIGCYIDYVSGKYDIDVLLDIVHVNYLEKFIEAVKQDIIVLSETCNGEIGLKFNAEVPAAIQRYKDLGKLKRAPSRRY
jgi:hypothetical protein